MQNVIVPLNAFGRDEVLKNGQVSYVEHIAQAGAYGIEIRRELLPKDEKIQYLDQLKQEIARFGLFTVYSAPIELWKEDHHLNTEGLKTVFQEGQTLGAKWLKVSLGHFQKGQSNITDLNGILTQHQEIQLFVENDQSPYGGNVQDLKVFFEKVTELNASVKMTFDVGNWYYTNQNIEDAVSQLASYVDYLHLKQVEKHTKSLVTLPLQKGQNHSWEKIVKSFPTAMTKALEFPIHPKEKTKEYLTFIQELEEEAFL